MRGGDIHEIAGDGFEEHVCGESASGLHDGGGDAVAGRFEGGCAAHPGLGREVGEVGFGEAGGGAGEGIGGGYALVDHDIVGADEAVVVFPDCAGVEIELEAPENYGEP